LAPVTVHRLQKVAVALLASCLGLLAKPSAAQDLQQGSPGPSMNANDRSALQSAVRDYQNGDAQGAEPALKVLLQRYPHNAEVLESLGLIYAEQRQILKALPLLESACSAQPLSPTVFENLGITYLKLGRNADALRVLRQAAVLEPDARHEAMIGTALMGLKRYGEAAQAFQVVSQADPADQNSRYQWALALLQSGDSVQAAERIQSVAIGDSSAQEQALLGDIHERQGRYLEAVNDLRSAVHMNPSQENVNALGVELLRHSLYDAALANYSGGLSRYPSSPRMMFGVGLSKYGTNDFTGAAGLFSALLRSEPRNHVYLEMLERSCSLNMSDPGSSCDAIILYAKTHPNDVTGETAAAATIMQRTNDRQDLTLAHTFLQRALAANSQSVEANYLMGVWYQQRLLWQESLPFLRKAVQIDPGYGKAHYRLARAFFRLGDHEDGEYEIARNAECTRKEQQKTDREATNLQLFLAAMH
jgi:tetratricopeptide (TPR) repeat protein